MSRSFPLIKLLALSYDGGEIHPLLSPDALPPEPSYGQTAVPPQVQGEAALMYAVLEDAIDCFQKQFVKGGKRTQRLAQEAEEWLFTNDPHWPFSFVNICAALGLDPEHIRMGLRRWRCSPRPQPKKGRILSPPRTLKVTT